MKKGNNYIKSLIIFSALALIGLICIQSYWMINGFDQQKNHHRDIIQSSLAEIVKEIEKYETLKKIERSGNLMQLLSATNIDSSVYNQVSKDLKLQDSILIEIDLQIKDIASNSIL